MQIGFIGLGKMGSRMVTKLLQEEHQVIVWNRTPQTVEEFKIQNSKFKNISQNLKVANSIEDLIKNLEKPRIVWTMVSAGEPTQTILDEVEKFIHEGDIVVDSGNSHFEDTEKRYRHFAALKVRYLGVGVSGGIIAAKSGYPLMAGGSRSAYDHIQPLLDSLAKPAGGYDYFGEGGAGHFVKMVHNGMEYGIMQSLGEGFGILEKAPYAFDLKKVAKLYQKGTLVSGFMLDRVVDALKNDPLLTSMKGYIGESTDGYAQHTVDQAKKEGVVAEIIEHSLEFRRRSQKDEKIQESFAAKLIAGLRLAFGGHEVKKR